MSNTRTSLPAPLFANLYASEDRFLQIIVRVEAVGSSRRHVRLVGAANYTHSLRSLVRLHLALTVTAP